MADLARKPMQSTSTSPMTGSLSSPQLLDSYSTEKHYSVAELAKLWSLSERTIRRMFQNEPGVFAWGSSETRFKRGYKTLRIPETVVLRIHRLLRNAS